MMDTTRLLVACLITLGAWGCGDDDTPADTGVGDTSTDVGMDAEADTSADAEDGSTDASEDAVADAPDAEPEVLELTDLVITVDGSPITLVPAFDPTITEYEAVVDTFAREVMVLATPNDPDADLQIDGRVETVGLPADVGVALGTHVLDIDLASGDLTSQTQVTITRDLPVEADGFAGLEDNGRIGWSMATSGDVLVVGLPFSDVEGLTDAGLAFVLRRIDGSWGLPVAIRATVPQAGARFGEAVATDGVRVAVGAFFEDVMHEGGLVMNAGAAYTFVASGPTDWVDDTRVTIASGSSEVPAENDQFGISVSISDGVLAVGSFTRETTGVVFVYQRDEATWAEPEILRPGGVTTAALFGNAVATSAGAYLFVGARAERTSAGGIDPAIDTDATESGAVFAFARDSEDDPWEQTAMIKAAAPQPFDRFGSSLAFDNLVLVVGAPGEDGGEAGAGHTDDDDASGPESGAVYRFRVSGTTWVQQAYLKDEVNVEGARFGSSVAHYGNLFVVGASRSGDQQGTASLFAYAEGDYVFATQLEFTAATGDLFGTSAAIGPHGIVVGYPQSDTGAGGVRYFE